MPKEDVTGRAEEEGDGKLDHYHFPFLPLISFTSRMLNSRSRRLCCAGIAVVILGVPHYFARPIPHVSTVLVLSLITQFLLHIPVTRVAGFLMAPIWL
jgi:hypothetical protein